MSACRRALCARAFGPPLGGDGGAEHPLGGGCVGPGAGRGGDGHGAVLLEGAMAGRVIRGAVLPTAPEHAAPGAAQSADRARVVVAAGDRAGVVVGGPGVPVAGESASVQTASLRRLLHAQR